VTAIASSGFAKQQFEIDCEDTITLTVQWENMTASDFTLLSPCSSSMMNTIKSLGTGFHINLCKKLVNMIVFYVTFYNNICFSGVHIILDSP
jgi:hypothetical protein